MKSDADWVLDACSSLFLLSSLFSSSFPPLYLVLEHTVDFASHTRDITRDSAIPSYCLFAHDTALLMEYITPRYITLQLPSGRILAANGSGLVSGLFGSIALLSQQVLGGNLRYRHMYLATYALLLIILFLAVQLIYPLVLHMSAVGVQPCVSIRRQFDKVCIDLVPSLYKLIPV